MTLPPPEKLNNFDIIIPVPRPNKIPAPQPKTTQPSVPEPDQGNPRPSDQASGRLDEPVPQYTDVPRTDQAVKDSQTPADAQPPAYNLRKRRADPDDTLEERQAKIVKAMLAIAQTIDIGPEEVALLASVGVETIPIPKTYEEAISDPKYGPEWLAAIQQEVAQLIANGTFEEEEQPGGVNLVTTKWVFLVKLNLDGSVERFKARLVARGFS